MKYSLVIFDMDGTILSTLEDIADSCNKVLQDYNFPQHTYEQIRFMVGNGIPKLIERILPEGTPTDIFEKVLADFLQYYKTHSAIKTKPYDGILDLLKEIKQKGIKIAVNTNKMEAAAVDLCNNYFPNLFDIIVGNRPELPTKPDPKGVFLILDQANISHENAKNHAVYIGDSDVDLQTAINAGLNVIGVDWGFRGKEYLEKKGATDIAITPKDVLKFLE